MKKKYLSLLFLSSFLGLAACGIVPGQDVNPDASSNVFSNVTITNGSSSKAGHKSDPSILTSSSETNSSSSKAPTSVSYQPSGDTNWNINIGKI